jgi:hypothetical protein
VPGEGFEPPACGLQNRCSTAELTRQMGTLHRIPVRLMHNGAADRVAPSPRSWGNRTRVYPSSVIMISRSRIYPTSAERVGVRGKPDRVGLRPSP